MVQLPSSRKDFHPLLARSLPQEKQQPACGNTTLLQLHGAHTAGGSFDSPNAHPERERRPCGRKNAPPRSAVRERCPECSLAPSRGPRDCRRLRAPPLLPHFFLHAAAFNGAPSTARSSSLGSRRGSRRSRPPRPLIIFRRGAVHHPRRRRARSLLLRLGPRESPAQKRQMRGARAASVPRRGMGMPATTPRAALIGGADPPFVRPAPLPPPPRPKDRMCAATSRELLRGRVRPSLGLRLPRTSPPVFFFQPAPRYKVMIARPCSVPLVRDQAGVVRRRRIAPASQQRVFGRAR